ncbi:hypothetical protein [Limnohabitans sp. Rim8]|uniref:hypothetical protein n=1 Tax=Limnohabitans sp. Rim8 TaxID=1100718 RepID=UPI0033069233
MKRKLGYISLSTSAGRRLYVPEAAAWSIRSAVMHSNFWRIANSAAIDRRIVTLPVSPSLAQMSL